MNNSTKNQTLRDEITGIIRQQRIDKKFAEEFTSRGYAVEQSLLKQMKPDSTVSHKETFYGNESEDSFTHFLFRIVVCKKKATPLKHLRTAPELTFVFSSICKRC